MKVMLRNFGGHAINPKQQLCDQDETFVLTGDDILRLFLEGHDVMLSHRREHLKKDKYNELTPVVMLDEPGRRFRQR